MSSVDVLWRRADGTGHDACSLTRSDAGWQVHGATVWAHDRKPAWLSYHMTSDQAWNVQAARLRGIVGGAPVDLSIRRRADGLWGMNGRGLPGSESADDLELCVTPACRLFTLRRAMGRPGDEVDLQLVTLIGHDAVFLGELPHQQKGVSDVFVGTANVLEWIVELVKNVV